MPGSTTRTAIPASGRTRSPRAWSGFAACTPSIATDSWRIERGLFDHGDYAEDASTGQPEISFDGGIKTDDHVLPGTGIVFGTDDFYVHPINSTRFQVNLDLSAEDGYTTSTIGNHPAVRAMVATLRATLTTGAAIPDPHDLLNVSQLQGGRQYTIPVSPALVVTVSSGGYSEVGSNVIQWSYVFDVVAPATSYDADAINTWLDANTQTIGTTGDVVVKSPMGQHTQPVMASEVDFGNGNKLAFSNGNRVAHVRKGSLTRRVAEGNNLVLSLRRPGERRRLQAATRRPPSFLCTTRCTSTA